MAKKQKSEFDSWFKSQFGHAPIADAKLRLTFERANALRREVAKLDDLIKRQIIYSKSYSAALYAWQARMGEDG